MANVTEKSYSFTGDATGSATEWIPLNINQENWHVSFAIKKIGNADGPTLNVDGTFQNVLTSATVVSADYFALISAVSTSADGTIVAGELTFPIAAVRLRNVDAGSGATTLNFKVIQAGKY